MKGFDFRSSERARRLFVCLWFALLTISAAYIFYGVWTFYFTGDDFTYIHNVKRSNVFLANPQTLHYQPVGKIIAAFPDMLVRPNPLYGNILLISFYLVATLLTVYVAYFTTRDVIVSAAAGFLFLTFANNHEIMFWKTGRITSAMTILCLMSFILFSKYLKSRGFRHFLAANLLLLTGILTTEQACFILPVWGLYELMYSFPKEKGNSPILHLTGLLKATVKYALPLSIIMLVFLFKILHGQRIQPGWLHVRPLVEATIGILDYNYLLSFTRILSAAYSLVKTFPSLVIAVIIILSLVSLGVCLLRPRLVLKLINASRDFSFFILWGFMTFIPLFAVMGPQSRYYAVASVGITIALAILLRTISIHISKPFSRSGPLVTELVFLSLALLVSVPGIRSLTESKANWKEASEVERKLVESFRFHTKDTEQRTRIYLLNLPDRLFAERPSFFIARNGFLSEVTYEHIGPITSAQLGIPVHAMFPTLMDAEGISFCEALDLRSKMDTLILIFDPNSERLIPWGGLPENDANYFIAHSSGFHYWESGSANKAPFRWTNGDGAFTLDVGCYDGSNRIQGVSIELAGSPNLSGEVVISGGNEELERLHIGHSYLRQYRILFPRGVKESLVEKGQLMLRIRSEKWQPSDYGLSPDTRSLGVAVGSVSLIE